MAKSAVVLRPLAERTRAAAEEYRRRGIVFCIPWGSIYKPTRDLKAFWWISNKQGQRIRLDLNAVQRDLVETCIGRDVVAKARQQGTTTFFTADGSAQTIWHPNMRYVQVVETEVKAKRNKKIVEGWLAEIGKVGWLPKIGVNNATTITFPGINSRMDFYSADGETPGRGDTINFLHCSEVAHWPRAEETFAALKPSVPPPPFGKIVLESTPNGAAGFFYNMYMAAKEARTGESDSDFRYSSHFYPWWWAEEYRLTPRPTLQAELTHEERALMKEHGLDLGQIAWRRSEMRESELQGGLFLQEYPEDDISCWFSSGTNVFGPDIVRDMRAQVSNPRAVPEVWEREDGYNGTLRVWKEPAYGRRYVIGADLGHGYGGPGRDADYSAAVVIDFATLEHVATMRTNRMPPERFAVLLDKLGRRYETRGTPAYLAIERRNPGEAVINMLRDVFLYPNLHSEQTRVSGREWEVGFMTSGRTKPLLITRFSEMLRTGEFTTHDAELVREINNYVYEDQSHRANPNVDVQARAIRGAHDDLLMAAMIAVQVREDAPLPQAMRPRPRRIAGWVA